MIIGQETEKVSDKMIGCLCWFNNYRETVIGILKEIQVSPQGEIDYLDDNGYFYPKCRPVKPDEVKFYNHIGDDNEKVAKLENDVKVLKEVLLKHCPELEGWVDKNFGERR